MTIYKGESDEAKSGRAGRSGESLRFFSKFYRASPGQAEVGRLLIRGLPT